MNSFLNIHYGPLPAHLLDLYTPKREDNHDEGSLIVFVHGGAWRSEDKVDHAQLAHRLVRRTHCAVAVPNYRLSPKAPNAKAVLHPSHASDMLTALEFLVYTPFPSDPGSSNADAMTPRLKFSRLYLIGHSCSAHMIASVFLKSPFTELEPSPDLLRAVQAIVLSEGIYDLDLLCQSFPTYRSWFVEPAFGPPSAGDGYGRFSVIRYPLREDFKHARWMLVQSLGDTLIDEKQTDAFYNHLRSLFDAFGDGEKVKKDISTITTEHNEMLKTSAYSDFVGDYFSTLL